MEPNQPLHPLSPQEQDPAELLVPLKLFNNKKSVNANHPVARVAVYGEEKIHLQQSSMTLIS
jgi:hypothetical protein